MTKILFMIHDLGRGGAEKVLVNLVNNMDHSKFEITVCSLFAGGVYDQAFVPEVKVYFIFKKSFPANSKILKLMSPKQLHKLFVKGHYDIEVSYLEGPSARIISGCEDENTKLVSWIHVEQHDIKTLSRSFTSVKEAIRCYNRFDNTVCVSEFVRDDFAKILNFTKPCQVLHNTVESEQIRRLSVEDAPELNPDDKIRFVFVGTLKASKGHDRLIEITKKLVSEGYSVHLYILGEGPLRGKLEAQIKEDKLEPSVTLLGFNNNPYKYVAKCDLFICASHAEGFSTAATEALIVGTPVCTVDVSGMKEMLGKNDEFGIVTANTDEALYSGVKHLLDDPVLLQHYREKAHERGNVFSIKQTVTAVENMLLSL